MDAYTTLAYGTLFDSIMAYFIFTGILQTFTSILTILLALEVFGQADKSRWRVFIIVLLISSLAFNFAAAVAAATLSNFFNKITYLANNYDGSQLELYNAW
jgi:hypothetical protein